MSGIATAFGDIAVIGVIGVGAVGALSLRGLAPPATPPFARPRSTGSSGTLYPDRNATFLYDRGFLFRTRCWFTATGCPPIRFSRAQADALTAEQSTGPVRIAQFNGRTWWLFEDEYHWSATQYTNHDVLALIRDRQRRQQSKLDRAHMALRMEQQPPTQRRGPLPRALKMAVFERDNGRCTQCGSTFDLQYDHVIPVAMGGATTMENLQLLCSPCNQSKGARL
jgi:5-methylcytosine-specific restriction endonuclease McrA